jgi:hypothetical protein
MIANAAVMIISYTCKAFIVQATDVYELILPWLLGQCEDNKKKVDKPKVEGADKPKTFQRYVFISYLGFRAYMNVA